jgi:NOL1/NOP2/sun family putative RNA methylase
MKLPVAFEEKMLSLMGENEYSELLNSYNDERHFGLRVNTLKISVEDFLKITPFELEKIPWTRDGFYFKQGESPGRHPHYHAGLYYIQEPSAMFPAEVMDAKPGERILDLCAAPGGKTVQLAAGMKGEGILVSNDISSDRIKALIKNIELCGIKNTIVTNEEPARLKNNFESYFDGVLVDAPCSGEGMFRKDESAVSSWGKFKCEKCCEMQTTILDSAAKMVKPGGRIVYSTCTFSPEEDELMISNFLDKNPEFHVEKINVNYGIENGRINWANGDERVSGTARLWPHKLRGEGHFVAKLINNGKCNIKKQSILQEFSLPHDFLTKMKEFFCQNMNIEVDGNVFSIGSNIYSLPCEIPSLQGVKVSKFGSYLGSVEKKGFEPSHSMLLTIKPDAFKRCINYLSTDGQLNRYLKGETLMVEGEKGYTCICVDGYTLGWAKQMGDMLKNLYPKGWRRMN